MGVRLKVNLLLVVALLVVLAAAGLFQLRFTERLATGEMARRGVAMLAALSVPCAVALANYEIERLDDYLAEFAPGRAGNDNPAATDVLSLAVLDRQGRVLAHTRETEFGSVLSDEFTREALAAEGALVRRSAGAPGGPPVLQLALPIVSGLRWGTLEARLSLERLQATIGGLRLATLLVHGLAVLAAVLVLSLGLGRLVLRPVARLAQLAEQLRQGRFDLRLPVRGADELALLALAFNEAATQLGDYTHRLEEKVRERSQQIVAKNEELERANRLLNEQARRLEQLATTDGLTGLANKRHWLERVGGFEIMRARRGRHPLSLLMIDVDHFKHYNDTNGHLAGDDLLAGLARLLLDNLRATDIAGRFGGEEFSVALLDTDLDQARQVAEKIRTTIAEADFPHQQKQPGGNLTVSIGVAELDIDQEELSDLINRADQALYRAKEKGRNRVET